MIDRQQLPAPVLDVPQRQKLLLRIAEVADARLVVDVFQGIDLKRLAVPPADETAGLERRVGAGLRDQLFELLTRQLHRIDSVARSEPPDSGGVHDLSTDDRIVHLGAFNFFGRNLEQVP